MQTIEKESASFHFTGVIHLLITGEGHVQLLKCVDGKKTESASYYPVTDASGEVIEFSNDVPNGVLFNAEIENKNQSVHYKIKLLEGQAKYMVAR